MKLKYYSITALQNHFYIAPKTTGELKETTTVENSHTNANFDKAHIHQRIEENNRIQTEGLLLQFITSERTYEDVPTQLLK